MYLAEEIGGPMAELYSVASLVGRIDSPHRIPSGMPCIGASAMMNSILAFVKHFTNFQNVMLAEDLLQGDQSALDHPP